MAFAGFASAALFAPFVADLAFVGFASAAPFASFVADLAFVGFAVSLAAFPVSTGAVVFGATFGLADRPFSPLLIAAILRRRVPRGILTRTSSPTTRPKMA